MDTISLELAVVDWVALVLILAGLIFGLMRGLGSAFAALLWVVAALWLGSALAPTVLGWMPNTADIANNTALTSTWGAIAAVIVILPLIGKVLGGSLGRKADDHQNQNRYMGGLVGLLLAVLVTTALTVFAPRTEATAGGYGSAFAPEIASTVSDQARFLYPEYFRDELGAEILVGTVTEATEDVVEEAVEVLDMMSENATELLDEALAPVIDETTEDNADG